MRTIIIITLCLLLSSIVSGCSSSATKYHAVEATTPRVSSLGFTISSPPGRNWYEKHHGDSLLYFKRTRGPSYALTTKATEISFPQRSDVRQSIQNYLDERKYHNLYNPHLRNCRFDYSFENIERALCASYTHSYDDYNNPGKGNQPYVHIFNRGMVCSNPHLPQTGIDIHYMEKSRPTTKRLTSYRGEGEAFLESLDFYNPSQ